VPVHFVEFVNHGARKEFRRWEGWYPWYPVYLFFFPPVFLKLEPATI
jgi:hypothetical protein